MRQRSLEAGVPVVMVLFSKRTNKHGGGLKKKKENPSVAV